MVGRSGRLVPENDPPARVDNEDPGQLQNIADRLADPGAADHGRQSLDGDCRREHSQRGHALEVELSVERLLRIGDHGEGDVEFLQERRAFRRRPHADQDHPGAGFLKISLSSAQLRDLLAAERSAEMPQKHQHDPAVRPKFAQTLCSAVRHRNVGIHCSVSSPLDVIPPPFSISLFLHHEVKASNGRRRYRQTNDKPVRADGLGPQIIPVFERVSQQRSATKNQSAMIEFKR